ncbi:sigma-70 family RNA polymerase sigma factor [Ornithinibacillus sp. 4-3]|uniref:Sigma-70 family RNA polymerase sigma factor n=1 Tax=Ornithinibacillus sp. 4-3 TaxID=3231488 RepID=A0AB39HRY6_9BACI
MNYLKLGLVGKMNNWADQLIAEYKEGRSSLKSIHEVLGETEIDNLDKTQINSMIDSMTYAIDWMEIGREPDTYRGADRRDAYRFSSYEDMDIIPDITAELKKERESFYMDRGQRQALINLLRNFSDRERQCFVMYEAEHLSMQKIADRLGISKWTVRTYIYRAREKVEAIIV